MLNYIYKQKPDLLLKVIQHSNRKAIIDLLPKLIQVESYDCDLAKEATTKTIRVEVLTEFVKKLKSNDLEVICTIILGSK